MLDKSFFIGISYVGGPEWTQRAVGSLGRYARNVFLVDNSDHYTGDYGVPVTRPVVPLSHTQTHNYFRAIALERGDDFYMVMHNDAEASPEVVEALAVRATDLDLKHERWGALFTNYDALACYSTRASLEVGPWDWQLFPSYYSECDYYYRCRLAGFELIDTGLPVKHEGSHVINEVDKWRKFLTALTFEDRAKWYVSKWGGHPGHETYTRPFDLDARGPYPDA